MLSNKYLSLKFRLSQKVARMQDFFRGTDFVKYENKHTVGIDEDEDAVYYLSSAFTPEFKKIFSSLQITNKDSILDYGCGKGAVLYQLRKYSFVKISGIELSQHLVEIAKKNLQKLNDNRINVINENAAIFTDIDKYNYFYFFNPFVGETFKKVIDNIAASYQKNKRNITIIYMQPKCRVVLDEHHLFRLKQNIKIGQREILVYVTHY